MRYRHQGYHTAPNSPRINDASNEKPKEIRKSSSLHSLFRFLSTGPRIGQHIHYHSDYKSSEAISDGSECEAQDPLFRTGELAAAAVTDTIEQGNPTTIPEHDCEITAPGTPTSSLDVIQETPGGFCTPKALLRSISALSTGHQASITVRDKIEGLISHIAQLDVLFATPPGDVAELRRRDELISNVEGVEGKLRALREKLETQRVADRSKDDEDMFMPLEDLQEVIFWYKMARQTAIDNQVLNSMDPADADVLNNFRCAQEAEYRHGNRNGCLKGTRSAILDEIELWSRDFNQPPVYWLNGLAGTGKSTIAHTISERVFADGLLGASFFCSRDSEDRRNLQFIFPTLAVQLARKYPEFRSIFVPLARSDPGIARESLYGQMNKLIFQPLTKSAISTVIVIDALDECRDEEPASAILSVLGQFVSKIPDVKFFVTGRPEPRIREGFRLPLLADATNVFVLHEIDPSRVHRDIRAFFTHRFLELRRRRRGLDGWPTEKQLELLCERAGGLFVHAVATIGFIDRRNTSPKKQLDRLLQLPGSSTLEGKTRLRAGATLDLLYATILYESFGDDDPEDDHRVRSVLGAVVLVANPLSPSAIATLLNLDPEEVFPLLSSVHSLLVLREDVNRPVRPFHKSFPDFITDPTRYPDPRFRVHPPNQHAELLIGCLELMNQRLEQNMCNLPVGVLNSEVDDLKERAEQHIDKALQYACRSWHQHLVQDVAPTKKLEIAPILHRFLEKKFLFWLEVLSVLGATMEAVDALKSTKAWLDGSSSLDLVDDCFRFLLTFFEVISTSATHIYISALPLSPKKSIIRELYQQYTCPFARVVRGLPSSWEPVHATTYYMRPTFAAAWSPCNKLIAVARHSPDLESGGATCWVEILDSVTLKRVSTFEVPTDFIPDRLGFSPDSRFIAGLHFDGRLATWDIQTGGLAVTKPLLCRARSTISSSTYSSDGRMFAFASNIPRVFLTFITIYDFARMRTKHHPVWEGLFLSPVWTHGESLRFATLESSSITVWELAFIGEDGPAKVGSLPAPGQTANARANPLFLPTLSRLAFYSGETVFVWDAQESKFLLKVALSDPFWAEKMSFSSDGRFFACVIHHKGLRVWKESPAGYIPHQDFAFARAKPLFSPNGGSIFAFSGLTNYLIPVRDPSLPPTTSTTTDTSGFTLEFFQNGELATVARRGSSTVTIFDLKSGDVRAVFDAGMRVFCLGVAGNALAAVSDEGMVITWNIPTGDSAFDAWENVTNNGRITILDYSQSRYPLDAPPNSISISPDLNYVAIEGPPGPFFAGLAIYDVYSGKCLARSSDSIWSPMWFTPEQELLYCFGQNSSTRGWKITGDSKCGHLALESVPPAPLGKAPWKSALGYEVTDDGWILNSTRKRLLWLPHYWRYRESDRIWHRRFLGLLQGGLPDVVVLEFFE